ncbi:hypothetical protein A9995_14970 [Erythrobacter sp. QSSC1-22B]|nr:hypothetical protein A9995_14970 [Erythrobacter sp. QSSC1-22B]
MLSDHIVDCVGFDGGGGIVFPIAGISAQAFPGQALCIEVVEIIIRGVLAPLCSVERHPLLQRLQAMVGVEVAMITRRCGLEKPEFEQGAMP